MFLSPVSSSRDSRWEKVWRLRWLEPASSAHDWRGGGKNSYMRYCSLPSVCIDCILSHNVGRGSTAIGRCQALLLSFTFFFIFSQWISLQTCLLISPSFMFAFRLFVISLSQHSAENWLSTFLSLTLSQVIFNLLWYRGRVNVKQILFWYQSCDGWSQSSTFCSWRCLNFLFSPF